MRTASTFLAIAFCGAVFAGHAAAENVFAVKGIHVDATAASATLAQNKAIAGGRAPAWTQLYRRLTRQQDWGRQPQLDDAGLTRILRGYSVANEKRSTTRYVADITYVFNPDAVAKVLQGANIAFTQTAGKTVLVIPLSPTYSPASPWTAAWRDPSITGVVPLALPTGDPIDRSELGSLGIGTATWSDVQPIASRARATEADVVLATPGNGKVTLQMRRLAPYGATAGGLQGMATLSVPVPAGQPPQAAWVAAAQAANAIIQNAWKSKFAINFNQQSSVTADVTLGSLADWAEIQAKLATIPTITGVTVVAMNMGRARLNIAYVGSPEQLREALREGKLSLAQNGGSWSLTRDATAANESAQ